MISYFERYHNKLLKALLEHINMVGITLIISVSIAVVITLIIMESRKISKLTLQICSVIYSIPSLALFAILIPLTGIGSNTAIIVLVIYNQYILVRGFMDGLQMVDRGITEAAVGMGMTKWQVFYHIRFPLSLDAFAASIRVAIISTIGIATIGATIGAGGLGSILFDGMRTQNTVKILWGIILSVGLVIIANGILSLIEKLIRKLLHR